MSDVFGVSLASFNIGCVCVSGSARSFPISFSPIDDRSRFSNRGKISFGNRLV